MELLLSAISAGGLVGASNQYLCLLLVSVAAKLDVITVTPEMGFMEAWWFIAVVAVFWLLTIAPAYATTLSPGVMNVVNTIVNVLSGFAVPASAALLALASVGIITGLNPDLKDLLETLQLFREEGGIGVTGFLVAGSSAVTATALTGSKFLAKPALSSATGTAGNVSAPIYATLENVASVVLMILLFVLSRLNPWLLVALLALVTLLVLGVLAYAVYQLYKLGKGIGKIIDLIEREPKAGLSVVLEFLVWGAGWLVWEKWNRGIWRLVIWALWLFIVVLVVPAAVTVMGAALSAIPILAPLVPVVGTLAEVTAVLIGICIGLRTARGLMMTFDEEETAAPAAVQAQAPSTP
jgi:hypothetical protein